METYCGIPVIDVDPSLEADAVSKRLVSAFEDVGFAYIKNTGITQQQIDDAFTYSAKFFNLSLDVKMKYCFPIAENKPAFGFIPPEKEHFCADKPMDVKEALDLVLSTDSSVWPSEELVPGFVADITTFIKSLNTLGYRLLHLIGKGLKHQKTVNKLYAVQFERNTSHSLTKEQAKFSQESPSLLTELFEKGDESQFRMVDYPKIADITGVQPGQLRCSEHTDYGGMTILFQDDCGGLEVMNREGKFVEAVPLKGTTLINIGDFLALCSNGQLKSTCHRVVISEKNFYKRRQSLVHFFDPDGDKIVQPTTTSGSKSLLPGPISYNMWRNQRFKETLMIQ